MAVTEQTYVKKKKDKKIDGLVQDDFSNLNRYTDVWRDDKNKEIWIGYEGTDFSNVYRAVEDLGSDAHIFFDTTDESEVFKNMDDVTDKVINKYGKTHKIHLTGHSRGGEGVRRNACRHEVSSAVTFNAGITPMTQGYEECKTNITHYTTGIDPISIGTLIPRNKERTYVIKRNKDKDPHTLKQFKPNRI